MNLNVNVIVRALIRWSWVLVLFLIVGYVLGKVLSSVLPPQYQTTSLLQLNGGSRGLVVQPVNTYANLVMGDAVLATALKSFPSINPASIGTKQLVVTGDPKSNSISIQVTLSNGKDAAGLANALAQLLVTQQNAVIKQQYGEELSLLNKSIQADQTQIANLDKQIIALASQPTSASNTAAIQQLHSQERQYYSRNTNDQNPYH